ncbi:hypothetical protein AMS68_003510 [Peltaster fructicola]|uniref:BTB domain-containing protein n=1 Tax=Peltaster fructicola TaxID=286661 RepID=A0A6H0XTE9_9PEZI|nr:hypothetical protein AMS68_003510 [Peltaster fructicola]
MNTHVNDPSPVSATIQSRHGSQVSLVNSRSDYESASEAELSQNEDSTPQAAQPGTATSTDTPEVVTAPASNLSGLVCNVHRTTGREPHPLVGATTTVLGDKLYVFGGRRLSRSKPLLTSNLYELDLVHRHWTRLDPTGDIPPPRYFHSMCTLGDRKLVCYGGMSPTGPADRPATEQSEVAVMSDIHIYDVINNAWTKVSTPDAPQGRYAHCTAILPSGAFFASPVAPMSAMHHNPQGENPNSGTLGVALDGTGGAEMIVVGGQDSANHYIEQISIFNLRSLKWTGTTGMGRSCGAYRSVVAPLTTMTAEQVGAGPHAGENDDDDDDEPSRDASSCPMLIYSNYNFLDVKLELQIRLTDGTLTEKPMRTEVSPPGLRFPNGGVIDKHFVVSGTFLTSSKQEYALWALDLRTLSWSRIDASSNIFSQGSWNRGVLWSRRNSFVILGNRRRNLVDDYNNRRINFTNICIVELEAFGLYDNPRHIEPNSAFVSASANPVQTAHDLAMSGRAISEAAAGLGAMSLGVKELSDMDFLAIDGTRIPVNSRLIARRWGPYFTQLLREANTSSNDTDTATLRPSIASQSRNSSITITPSVTTTATNNSMSEIPDVRSLPPPARARTLYLPHTTLTLHALLHFLYTSDLPAAPSQLATPQVYCSLLQLARPYRVDGLLEAVVQRLHESLDGRNAAAIFNAAAMGAGGGEGGQFASSRPRDSMLTARNVEGITNGAAGLRVNTDMHDRDKARPTTARPDDTDDEGPLSAATEASMSGSEASLGTRSLTRIDHERPAWDGAVSAVVGLQKRGLRGLMEGRRMRERGRSEVNENARVGLGIASA